MIVRFWRSSDDSRNHVTVSFSIWFRYSFECVLRLFSSIHKPVKRKGQAFIIYYKCFPFISTICTFLLPIFVKNTQNTTPNSPQNTFILQERKKEAKFNAIINQNHFESWGESPDQNERTLCHKHGVYSNIFTSVASTQIERIAFHRISKNIPWTFARLNEVVEVKV